MQPSVSGLYGFRRRTPRHVGAVVTLLLFAAGAHAQRPQRVADAAERAGDAQDKIICKRFVETGSLVKGYRTCQTKREWERERDNIRAPRAASGSCNSAESGNCGGV
jgi:hypothetical protein